MALRIVREDGPIDLVLTDVVMTGMSGIDLAATIRLERPDVPVLYMSGYTDAEVLRLGVLDKASHFVQKPFTPLALTQHVRDAMRSVGRPRKASLPAYVPS